MFFNDRCCARRHCCHHKPMCNPGCGAQPIMEPVINKYIETETFHEVPHICPVHTHKMNKQIFNHMYTPQYTFSEEDVIINNDSGSCCGL